MARRTVQKKPHRKKKLKILVLGGRGFVGKAICKALRHHHVTTFDRHVGGKDHIQGSILHIHDVGDAVEGKDVVINLVGLTPIKDLGYDTYKKIHVDGARNVVIACKSHKVKRLLHMSALGANVKSSIAFLQTKGQGEKIVLNSGLKATVFCPSIIIGKNNEFIVQLRTLAFTRMFPNIPANVQPVCVTDIAKLYALAIDGVIKEKKLEVGGPNVLSLFEIAKRVYGKLGYLCVGVPLMFVKIGMRFACLFGLFGIGKDQIAQLTLDNTTSSRVAQKYLDLTSFDDWLKRTSL